MENGQKTILTLFSGDKHFVVPKYQRAYAWEEEQLKNFLEDIQNQKNNKDYFLGTILFQDKGINDDGFEQIEIVDGQQRIITIAIFMKVMLNILKEKDKESDYSRDIRKYLKDEKFYKIETIPMDNDFFKTYIIEDNHIEDKFLETPSQKRLSFAKKYFESKLIDIELNILKDYKKKIEKTKILTYSVNDSAEATLIFETTNDRGKDLTNLEKIKSFLMHKVYLTKEKPQDLLESIHDRFSKIYRILEQINYKIGEDSILQYHFISHLDWGYYGKNKDYHIHMQKLKEKINIMMQSNNPEEASQFIDKYTRELMETFNTFKEILNDKNIFLRDFFILGRLSPFFPLIIKCYKFDTTQNKLNFYKMIRLLEIFSFRVYAIARKPSKTGETWLYALARDFKGDFDKLKQEIIDDGILYYVNDREFKSKLSSTYLYHDLNSADINYLFWKYENYIRTNEQPVVSEMSEQEFLNQDPKCKLTVEHIVSQTPKVCTSALKLPNITDEFYDKYMHSIGNLTFDPNSANASKNNNVVEIKNSKYFVKAPFKIQNELNDFVLNGELTEEAISKRAEKIIGFAMQYWDTKNIN